MYRWSKRRCDAGTGAGVGYNEEVRASAQALGVGGRKTWYGAPPSRSQPRPGALTSARGVHESAPRWTHDQLQRGRQNYEENSRRSQESLQIHRQRDQARREREQREQREQAERRQRMQEQVVNDPAKIPTSPYYSTNKRPMPPRSTHTSATSRVCSKKPKTITNNNIFVWQCGSVQDSLVERAIFEGQLVPHEVDTGLILACIRDGVTIRNDYVDFYTEGLSYDKSMHCAWWQNLVAGIQVDASNERAIIKNDGGTGCTRVGIGTFNAVVKMPKNKLPLWIPENAVVRLTRPDRDPESKELKYQNVAQTIGEMSNAMFASANGIGPKVYSLAAFSAFRPARTLRFGVVTTLCRAHKDLNKALGCMSCVEEGQAAACACIDLLFNVSRLGIAFYDMKPGNILQFLESGENGNTAVYRLTDFDPAFFVRTYDRDWRSLLLLNLALLSAHIYNSNLGPVGRGWAQAVKPVLKQLIERKDEYDSKWIFLSRCANLDFETAKNTSDFELQRLFVSIGQSYFYGERRREALSFGVNWKNIIKNSADLRSYWSQEKNKTSWPPSWSEPDEEPLIKQLVDMSLRYA